MKPAKKKAKPRQPAKPRAKPVRAWAVLDDGNLHGDHIYSDRDDAKAEIDGLPAFLRTPKDRIARVEIREVTP